MGDPLDRYGRHGRRLRSRRAARAAFEGIREVVQGPLYFSADTAANQQAVLRTQAMFGGIHPSFRFEDHMPRDPLSEPPQQVMLDINTGRTPFQGDWDRQVIPGFVGTMAAAERAGDMEAVRRYGELETIQSRMTQHTFLDTRMSADPSEQHLRAAHYTQETQAAAISLLPRLRGQTVLSDARSTELSDETPEIRHMMANETGDRAISDCLAGTNPLLYMESVQNLCAPTPFVAEFFGEQRRRSPL